MKCIRPGHYQATIPYGQDQVIIVNIVKIKSNFKHSITKWRLTVDDSVLGPQVKSDWDSKNSAMTVGRKEVENLMFKALETRIIKGFQLPKDFYGKEQLNEV